LSARSYFRLALLSFKDLETSFENVKGGSASHAQKSKVDTIATRLIHVVRDTNFDELLLCKSTQPLAALTGTTSIRLLLFLGLENINKTSLDKDEKIILFLEQEPIKARSAEFKLGY